MMLRQRPLIIFLHIVIGPFSGLCLAILWNGYNGQTSKKMEMWRVEEDAPMEED